MTDAPTERRPLWLRVLQFPLVRLVLLGAVLFLLAGVSNSLWGEAFADRPLIAVGIAAVMAVIGLGVYAGFVRLVEQRPVSELALSKMGRELGLGLLGGAALYTLCVVILMVLGVYRIESINPVALMLPSLAMAVSSGVLEELLHRGAIFRNVEELLGSWIALLASALFFGLRHLGNADGNMLGALAITIEAGLLLAALYLLTRRLWLCIGFHMAWNFTQAGVFSGSVSGAYEQPGLFKSVIAGPDWLTGGEFGMEASLVALVLCTSLGLAVLIAATGRGNIVPPYWMRKA